ncbi:class I SAM-dependent methyltransferase [Rhodococcoides corynebacterioides]|uniref:Methyltransferase domain-containing protein n=1 Tax=Rhodococcoides corynebacterioides TaxID=53972 RepID=A0ABS7P463_9NOCA|nr:class I SAM-dependent methyltransferase [Rhodococcus corynebacterioides]MBY6367217.1 methyltransferase domain-containing protein [Rhodococcus corynebacterioides]MBY6407369.1 methyltransferase domain-containing protein [Rhodococcus corynebacterioides]
MSASCRVCGAADPVTVLDLGAVPAADHFPPVESDPAADPRHVLRLALCAACGLAQLPGDDTIADEPRGVEPEAVRLAGERAIEEIAARGWVGEATVVREFGSPHGGSWIPGFVARGVRDARPAIDDDAPADLIVDGLGLMHEPNQAAALRDRARRLTPDGVLVLQIHSLATIVRRRQWTSVRHGHFAYWSLTALERALSAAGLVPTGCWESDLYGGTLLVTARPTASAARAVPTDLARARDVLADERALGVTDPAVVSELGSAVTAEVQALRRVLTDAAAEGISTAAYGAASRAVALFALAGVDAASMPAVVDASPAKWGRRMPGTTVPIVGPDWLAASRPDRVVVTVPDLLTEVAAAHPGVEFHDLALLTEGPRR